MRIRAIVALLGVGALAACGRPSQFEAAKPLMENELALYFANLNNDAEQRKLDLKTPRRNPDDPISTGRIYSDYLWSPDPNMVVITAVDCGRCKATQIVPGYLCENNPRVICPTCAAGDEKSDKASKAPPLLDANMTFEKVKERCGEKNVRRMFDLGSDPGPKEPLKATITYVRRLWLYDAFGKVEYLGKSGTDLQGTVSNPEPYGAESVYDDAGRPVGSNPNPTQYKSQPTQTNYFAGGFHRLDSVFIGTFEVEYDGALKVKGQPKEEGVKPWNQPRSLTGPQRYQTRGR